MEYHHVAYHTLLRRYRAVTKYDPPVIRLQHLYLIFEPLFILQVAVVPLTEQHEATEERVVLYVMILRVLLVFVRQGLYAFDKFQ